MDDKKCDCIFCVSRCPECGSTKIDVKYSLEYNYINDDRNEIDISWVGSGISLNCQRCFCSFESNGFECCESLDPICVAIKKHLDPQSITVKINEDGVIETEGYKRNIGISGKDWRMDY